ncbi:MAG: hypothetical protein JWR07_4044 [Nevskia sp.]|nr:hypothetical protein [Nevskia sp.]
MSAAQVYLPPVLAMVALSFLIALSILITRFVDLLSKRKSVAYYEDWDGTGASVAVMRPTRQLTNLFEFPVLFYTVVAMIIAVGLRDSWMPKLCWAYVALRWMHAFIHIFVNRLWIRTPAFMVGQFVLLGIWVRLGFVVFN